MGISDPYLDGRIDFQGTLAQLRAQFSNVPIGTRAITSDYGPLIFLLAGSNTVADWYSFPVRPLAGGPNAGVAGWPTSTPGIDQPGWWDV